MTRESTGICMGPPHAAKVCGGDVARLVVRCVASHGQMMAFSTIEQRKLLSTGGICDLPHQRAAH